jgi:two-component system response regulator AtoC
VSDKPDTVLVVDDDAAVATVLVALLGQAGLRAAQAASGEDALARLATHPADVVVTDLRMPGMGGMKLLEQVATRWPGTPVIVLTAHGTVADAVEAMKVGAHDFLLKPFDREQIVYVVKKALLAARHEDQPDRPAKVATGGFVSASPAMKEVTELVARAAQSTATVLLRGESGTGKEVAARAIHDGGPRQKGPFVALHCAALPAQLLESELFGYEKGAFTGAACRKPGRIELAHGGTLFLDEIGDVPRDMQVKLLRVLQERAFERLGGTETVRVDVRIVAATHQDLEAMVAAKEFREDLFYRLSVIPIVLPPLRERPEDIEPLVVRFCAALGAANGKPGVHADAGALALLAGQPWPGNVRQLQNFVERLIVLSDGVVLGKKDVARELARAPFGAAARPGAGGPAGGDATLEARVRDAEREALRTALDRAAGNRAQAARILGVSRRTLYYKLEEHKL